MEGRDFDVDRISELPCSVLTHILSLLPTEEAVRTLILSKRWINVWASLTVLKFDAANVDELASPRKEHKKCMAKHMRFVDGVLNHRENIPLDTFILRWQVHKKNTSNQVLEFLRRAAECMPRVINIDIYTDILFDLPAPMFMSESIEEMSLMIGNDNDENVYVEPKSINLPSLKKLSLHGSMYMNDSFVEKLFFGCPLLEELVLNEISLDVREISSDVLKRLVLNDCSPYEPLHISCPGVVSLHMDCLYSEIILKNMFSLINAEICLKDHNCMHLSSDVLRLLDGLSDVTNLRLDHCVHHSSAVKFSLVQDTSNCPAFSNLTRLDLLVTPHNYGWYLVDWFLQFSPNLKELTLLSYRWDEDASEDKFVRALSIQREYLEAVVIIAGTKFSREIVSTLGMLVKKIGRITISQ